MSVKQVSAHDNYFELGGDSIRSIRVVAKARERGLNLGIQQLFQHHTIAEITKEISPNAGTETIEKTERFGLISEQDRLLIPEGIEDAYPLEQALGRNVVPQ